MDMFNHVALRVEFNIHMNYYARILENMRELKRALAFLGVVHPQVIGSAAKDKTIIIKEKHKQLFSRAFCSARYAHLLGGNLSTNSPERGASPDASSGGFISPQRSGQRDFQL